jgi:hypothetical protein
VTRYATVRLLTAALFAVLIVGGTTASAYAVGAGVDVGTLLLTLGLGLLSFGVLVMVLLFDSRRRHQLVRALRSRWAWGRLLLRERVPDDEQLAEMRRRLDYALEGLRSAVAKEPATVGVTPGLALLEDGRRPGPVTPDAARDAPTGVTAQVPETRSPPARSTDRAPGQSRPPVSAQVAQGAFLVKASSARYRQSLGVAEARARLVLLRHRDDRSIRRAAVSRWGVRSIAVLIVPATIAYQVLGDTSWLAGVWAGTGGQVGLLGALALGIAGSVWTFAVTRPVRRLRLGSQTKAESHAVRSLFAAEQLALRLAFGAAPPDAWHAVARTNHFPAGSAIPARDVDDALALVDRLRGASRRRHRRPIRKRLASIALPYLSCLLPASVIIYVL